MPSLILGIDPYERPLVQVEVKPSWVLQQALYAHPPNTIPTAEVTFLVDTGSTHCAIDETLIDGWHLPKVQPKLVLSAQRPAVSGHDYHLSLKLHRGAYGGSAWNHGGISVTGLPSSAFHKQAFQGVIGMDLLRGGSINFDGPSCRFELSWRI